METAPRTKSLRTLWYPAAYLTSTGLCLLIAPDLSLRLLFSNGHYGPIMPRMAGTVVLVLGVLVVQTIRFNLEVLVPTLIYARVFFCSVWMGLFLLSGDPFFLVVFGVVGAGLIWTSATWLRERPRPPA